MTSHILSESAISSLLKSVLDQVFAQDFVSTMVPVAMFVVILTIYSILIWHFYRSVSKRDIFSIDPKKFKYEGAFGKFFDVILYLFKYTLIYPLLTFVFFFGYAVLLIFLSKSLDVNSILLTSISLISAIRVAAYYNEDLSKDLAKLFPFVMLAIFLLDPSFFSIEQIIQKIFELPNFFILGLRFILFVILLEWFLRIFYSIYSALKLSLGLKKRQSTDQGIEEEIVPEEQ